MKFLIADDHQLFSDGLGTLLGQLFPDSSTQGVAGGGAALDELADNDDYDLLLLDLRLPDMDGRAVLGAMHDKGYSTPAAIISATGNPAEIRRCLDAGAIGFIHKSVGSDELREAVERLLEGERYVSGGEPEPTSHAVADYVLADGSRLTRRQREVLELLADGLLNKQIAERLGTSEHTVKIHVSGIMKKLGARTRTACVNEAIRLGMLR
jgi:DNA-binding NarL/FixJ family response regulator